MSAPKPDPSEPAAGRETGVISVCIAAYNEAATISRLLEQLRSVPPGDLDEVLVCANGCTDGTEEVVERHAREDRRIRLILSSKGKPAAWNELMRSARNDVRLFLDADVELAVDFFPALRAVLERCPEAAIVAARDLPRRHQAGFDAALAALASKPFGFDYVCGRAYALRLGALQDVLSNASPGREAAIPEIPQHVLHEDLWLEVVVGRQLLALAPHARVYYNPGTVQDLLKTRARLRVARDQVAGLLPQQFARWRADTNRSGGALERLRQRLRSMDGVVDAGACAVGSAARMGLLLWHQQEMRRIRSAMREQMTREGGQNVLAGSGRLSKGGSQ